MPQNFTQGYKALMAKAEAEVDSVSAAEAIALANRDDVVIVGIRNIRELEREGRIRDPFPRRAASGWRSLVAGATLTAMGPKPVKNLKGGFTAWKEAGGAIESTPARK